MSKGLRTQLIWYGMIALIIGIYQTGWAFWGWWFVGMGLTLWGCYIWVRLKNQHWGYMFFGIITPIGLLVISALQEKPKIVRTVVGIEIVKGSSFNIQNQNTNEQVIENISQNKSINYPIWALSIALFVISVWFIVYYFQSSSTINNNKGMINSLQENIVSLTSQVASLTTANDTLSSQVIPLTNKNQELTFQVTSLTKSKESLDSQVEYLIDKSQSLKSQVDTLTNTNKTYSDQISSQDSQISNINDKLALYQDTFGSLVTTGESPHANWQEYTLVNNPAAVNPTYNQLRNFLLSDQTDKNWYIPNYYVCTDFAQDVHNNAERAGIRCGWVGIDFKYEEVGHACNVFKTSDRGLIFIDCTSSSDWFGPSSNDTTVDVKIGYAYKPRFLFTHDWTVESIGIVSDIQIYW